jgi:hypothetical protein
MIASSHVRGVKERKGDREKWWQVPSFDGLRPDFEGLRKKLRERGLEWDLVELVFLVLISFIARYRDRR